MNKRQKKKFIKKNMIKLRKIHPNEGDIVVLQFDPGNKYIDIDTILGDLRCAETRLKTQAKLTIVGLLSFHAM